MNDVDNNIIQNTYKFNTFNFFIFQKDILQCKYIYPDSMLLL